MDLPKIFEIYLKTKGVSPLTRKNYLSDLRHFLGWLGLGEEPKLIAAYLTRQLAEDYKNFLLVNQIPPSTINRRLSTLRSLGQFCFNQGWLKTNPLEKLANYSSASRKTFQENLLPQFAKTLKDQGKSRSTIKNYLVDIRQFLNWLEAREGL